MISHIVLVLNALSQLFLCAAELEIFSAKFIDTINRGQTLWKAGKNFEDNVTEEFLQILTTTADPDKGEQFSFKKPEARAQVPKFFDSRERWPNCGTLKRVPNQGRCSNCWAATMAVTLSCRLCIQSNRKYDYDMSMDHLTRCCADWNKGCSKYGNGCYGGYASFHYRFWISVGTVSGGYFRSTQGCRPYSDELFYYFKRYPRPPNKRPNSTLQCIKKCSNTEYKKSFRRYLMRGKNVNYLYYKDPMYIQLEIMNNGPVHAHMRVYKDFKTYQNGIYFHRHLIPNEKSSWHSVMILGWGEEKGVKYWLVCNTWGHKWGKLGGYFKIKRGNNECEIESRIYGPWFGFGRRAANKTVKTEKTSSSMTVRIENLVIVVNFLVLVMMKNNILGFNKK